MGKCDGEVRSMRSVIAKCDGGVRWQSVMAKCDGKECWRSAMRFFTFVLKLLQNDRCPCVLSSLIFLTLTGQLPSKRPNSVQRLMKLVKSLRVGQSRRRVQTSHVHARAAPGGRSNAPPQVGGGGGERPTRGDDVASGAAGPCSLNVWAVARLFS